MPGSNYSNLVLLGLIAGFMAVMGGQAIAQQTGSDEEDQTQNRIGEQEILAYIAGERVLSAGIGFQDVQLGDSMQSVLDRWGQPSAARKAGFLGLQHELLFTPDPNTAIVFSGRNRVKTITVKGNQASAFRTRKGARFGMAARTLTRFYSLPDSGSSNRRLEYSQRGISFFMKGEGIDKIVVYQARP